MIRLSGQIRDFNGERLELELSDGTIRTISAAQVIDFATRFVPEQTTADDAYREGRYAEAAALYQKAMQIEPRAWVRRIAVAQIVRCRWALGQAEAAGESFLVLLQADPTLLQFDCIPLHWLYRAPEAPLEQSALRWAARAEPAARLMAASVLVASPHQRQALALLEELARSPDSRVAVAAEAQLLRPRTIELDPAEVRRRIDALTKPTAFLRPGLSYLLGRAEAAQKRDGAAAVAFLRSGLCEPVDRGLAAQALVEASEALSRAGDARAAEAVRSEIVVRLGDQSRVLAELAARDPLRFGRGSVAPRGASLSPLPLAERALATASTDRFEDEVAFLDALRARGLSRWAAEYCRSALADRQLAPSRRAEWTIEWIRSLTQEALGMPPTQRESLWHQIDQAAEQFGAERPDDLWAWAVRLQTLSARRVRFDAEAFDARSSGSNDAALESAKQSLRGVIGELNTILAELEQAQRAGGVARGSSDRIDRGRLEKLRRAANFEIAQAYLALARCYPERSDDRTHALVMAGKALSPLSQGDHDDLLRWRSRLALMECYRLLSEFESVHRALDIMKREHTSPEQQLALRAEELRLAVAEKQYDQAASIIASGREILGRTDANLDLAHLEAIAALRRAAQQRGDRDEADRWLQRAQGQLKLIEESYGPSWGRRAALLVGGAIESAEASDVALLVRIGENAYHAERYDEALAAYERARAASAAAGNGDEAFRLDFTAATIARRLQRHADATARYRRAAVEHPQHAKAAEAHLLAIDQAAEWAKAGDPTVLKQYESLLDEHLRLWPESASADEARWRKARLLEYQQRWSEATAAYQAVSPNDSRWPGAVAGAERCLRQWLKTAGTEVSAETLARIEQWFLSVAVGGRSEAPPRWTPAERNAALAAVRLRLGRPGGANPQAIALLAAAWDADDGTDARWRAAAEAALVAAWTYAGNADQAMTLLTKHGDRSLAEWDALLQSLRTSANSGDPVHDRAGAELQLQIIDRLRARRGELSPQMRWNLDVARAEALLASRRFDEAAAAFASLVAARDNDLPLRESYARALSGRGRPDDRMLALEQWAIVQKGYPTGSPPWLRAQLAMAELELQMGRAASAAQRLRTIERLYPPHASDPLRETLERLLREVGR